MTKQRAEDVTVEHADRLAERFNAHGSRLKAVALRMLGSPADADDAVQEAWLRLSRSEPGSVDNLGAWLTTVVGRVCLDMLRARKSRREEPVGTLPPEQVAHRADAVDPECETLLTDSVGLAMLVVLQTLEPAERLAFVLHDVFAVPFNDIAPIVGRSPTATRQLASRGRRRVRGRATVSAADISSQRKVVNAFLAASRGGDFDALLAILDPDVVLRTDQGVTPSEAHREVHGAEAVAGRARLFSERNRFAQPALVDGTVGIIVAPRGQLWAVLRFTIEDDRIVDIDVITEPVRLRRVDLAVSEF